ncbi:MAG: AAA family ATPase, partial [Acidobacteriota bacterium]|nr:AAA family ATPase [Acidobacteriota bacterium]
MTPRPVCYGEANFRVLREADGYFVDKTSYIPMLEVYKSPVYLRPRRFGKSFLCSMLSTYYDVNMGERFDEFFGDTFVGANPTAQRNSCLTLHFDFSIMKSTGTAEEVARSFHRHCNFKMNAFLGVNRAYFTDLQNLDLDADASHNLDLIMSFIEKDKLPPLFVTIDEYDNFANQMIVAQNNTLYDALTADGSFFKTFFKTLKMGKGQATI